MRALWLDEGRFTLEEIDVPSPAEGELLVQVRYAGICGTDMALRRGYYGFSGVPGHEFTGTVTAGSDQWHGKRIVSSINVVCGKCAFCRRGESSHCQHRDVLGIRNRAGAFAEYISVPADNARVVPDDIDDYTAVLVEPLAAALEILEQVTIHAGDRALVVGAGRLAQLVVQVLASRASVDVVVRNPARASRFAPLPVRCIDVAAAGEGRYDLVVECTGQPDGFAQALAAVRARGVLVMKSTYADWLTIDASRIVVDEISLLGSRCGPFDTAISWLREGRIETSHLTFRTFPLAEFERAFEAATDPGIYKVLLAPNS